MLQSVGGQVILDVQVVFVQLAPHDVIADGLVGLSHQQLKLQFGDLSAGAHLGQLLAIAHLHAPPHPLLHVELAAVRGHLQGSEVRIHVVADDAPIVRFVPVEDQIRLASAVQVPFHLPQELQDVVAVRRRPHMEHRLPQSVRDGAVEGVPPVPLPRFLYVYGSLHALPRALPEQ